MRRNLRTNGLNPWLLACFLGFNVVLNGQEEKPCVAGIYKTVQDFNKNRLSHKVNTAKEGTKFKFRFPADLKLTLQIVTPDTNLEFTPGSIYGYRQCGRRYRYYAGGDLLAQADYYRVEEEKGLIIYSSAFVSGDEIFYSRGLHFTHPPVDHAQPGGGFRFLS